MARQQQGSAISVVIPTRNTRALVERCVASLGEFRGDVIVVDDGSEDSTVEALEARYPWVRVLRNPRSQGYARAVNRGVEASRGKLVLVLNSDTEVRKPGVTVLEGLFGGPTGIVGGSLHYPDGSAQWSGGREPTVLWLFALSSGLGPGLSRVPGYRRLRPVAGHGGSVREVEWVTGAAMAFRREVWRDVGPFDESFRFYAQDLEFCSRARRHGWRVVVAPEFRVVHHHGATIGKHSGTADSRQPALLWCDLLRWAGSHRGQGWARAAKVAVVVGAMLRIAARGVKGLFLRGPRRVRWQRDSLVYRDGLRAALGHR